MSGQVDLEVSYWGLLLKYGNARATLVRLHDDAASLEARQAGVRASLGRGQLLPSSMAEVMTVRLAFDESMQVAQAASALRRQLQALSLVVRYQCLAFADESGVLPVAKGHPVWLLLAETPDHVVRLKPQNLLTGLPLAGGAGRPS